jgi:hypothetical protein
MSLKNRQVLLASRPKGEPTPENFRLVEAEVPRPGPDQMLLRTVYLSLDPYMRGRMNAGPSRLQDAVKRPHGRHQVGGVHEDVIGDQQVKLPVLKSGELGAGVHPEVDAGVVRPRDLDHPPGKVHAGDAGDPVAEPRGEVAGSASGVEHGKPKDVTGELPQDGVGVEPPVAVPVSADLHAPVIGEQVPAVADLLERPIAHRSFSSPDDLQNCRQWRG